jgi:hypothetical protein
MDTEMGNRASEEDEGDAACAVSGVTATWTKFTLMLGTFKEGKTGASIKIKVVEALTNVEAYL